MEEPVAAEAQEDGEAPRHEDGNLQGSIKMATILMVCFLAEHNLPYVLSDHLTDLCKVMFPDSQIAQGIHMKRTRCTELSYKLAETIQEELAEKLRTNQFSMIIDESTDTSKAKNLCIVVKFYDKEDGFIKTRLLALKDIYI